MVAASETEARTSPLLAATAAAIFQGTTCKKSGYAALCGKQPLQRGKTGEFGRPWEHLKVERHGRALSSENTMWCICWSTYQSLWLMNDMTDKVEG